jgi:hypothetical protein
MECVVKAAIWAIRQPQSPRRSAHQLREQHKTEAADNSLKNKNNPAMTTRDWEYQTINHYCGMRCQGSHSVSSTTHCTNAKPST